jgi:transposase-like protein
MDRTPRTLLEAVTYFSDPDRAHAFAVKSRWPNGVACPRMGCGSADVLAIPTRRTWKCRECGRQFSVKVGTIFEASPLSLSKWLPAVWLLTNTKNGTSSCELARALGVTQKTAWFMFHRIRLAMKTPEYAEKLSGYVEADETYVGGKAKNRMAAPYAKNSPASGRRRHRQGPPKAAVLGMIERYGGKVRAMTISQTTGAYLQARVRTNVKGGSTVYTDAHRGYIGLDNHYVHYVIDHAVRYVEGHVHTNSIENFWSCLKRTLGGTYISVRPFHLDAYLDEQVFRFNERTDNDGGRFVKVLKGVDGRRLTYARLISANPMHQAKLAKRVRKPRHDAQRNPVF